MNKQLKNYEKACEELMYKFLEDLYKGEAGYYDDHFWVGDTVGEVLSFGDYFVSMENVAGYYRFKYTPEKFFAWYDQYIGMGDSLSMATYSLIKKL